MRTTGNPSGNALGNAASPALSGSRPRQRSRIEAHDALHEAVLYDPERDMAFSLNVSAKAIWELCDGRRTVAEISEELGQTLGCSGVELLPDVGAAILYLHELDLVEVGANFEGDPA